MPAPEHAGLAGGGSSLQQLWWGLESGQSFLREAGDRQQWGLYRTEKQCWETSLSTAQESSEGSGAGDKKDRKLLLEETYQTVLLLVLLHEGNIQSASVTMLFRAWHWWAFMWQGRRVKCKGPAEDSIFGREGTGRKESEA